MSGRRTKWQRRNSKKWIKILSFTLVSSFLVLTSHPRLVASFGFSSKSPRIRPSIFLCLSSSLETTYLRELDSVDELREGSLVMSRVESSLGCHDLRQPYFHKAVILILDHDPDDFTQGVLLNRASDLTLDDKDIVYTEAGEEDDEEIELSGGIGNEMITNSNPSQTSSTWKIHFGGDIGGWYEEVPQLLCIHGISSEAALAVSDPIFGIEDGVYITSHLGAQSLIESEEATSDDFYTFSGFCGWEEGQLQREVERGSWCLASFIETEGTATNATSESKSQTNDHKIMQLIEKYSWKNPEYKPQSGGLEFWHELMAELGKDNVKPMTPAKTTEDNVSHHQPFSDLMVKEWSTQRLLVKKETNDNNDVDEHLQTNKEPTSQINDADIFRALKAATKPSSILPGAIIRGSSSPSSPFLISGQLFHKSTILFLQDNPEASVGVLLNLPTKDAYILSVEGKDYNFPIRYGGPSGKRDEAGPYFWFHDNDVLKEEGIGIPISFSNSHPERSDPHGIHVCEIDDVYEALQSQLVTENEFLLVQGFCAWEKAAGSAGGITGQLLNGNLEDTNLHTTNLREKLWKSLLEQKQLLSEDCLRKNFELSELTWRNGRDAESNENLEERRRVFESDVKVSKLADDALWVWMRIFLLGNGEYYPEDL